MTEQQHPITMPPELVKELWDKFRKTTSNTMSLCRVAEEIAWKRAISQAVHWATDQANADIERKLQEAVDKELEECRQWLEINGAPRKLIDGLLVARCCPEPPSEKQQALDALLRLAYRSNNLTDEDAADVGTIRRAIEQLPTGDS